jgi:hypothetical protein
MPIPDYVTFGVNELNKRIDFGYVREITDETKLIELLKYRLNTFFINQVEPIKTPFPLSTMICVGVETLGQIFIKDKTIQKKFDGSIKEKKESESFRFVEVFKKLHQGFSHPVGEKFKKNLGDLWKGEDVTDIDTLSLLVYKFFRNTMIHGYHGKGVYLSVEDTKSFIKHEDGYLVLNPYWLWEKFKDVYAKLFNEAIKGQGNNQYRINALIYINNLLSKAVD